MIYTPAADSTYDDAFGFITDPLICQIKDLRDLKFT